MIEILADEEGHTTGWKTELDLIAKLVCKIICNHKLLSWPADNRLEKKNFPTCYETRHRHSHGP